MTTSADGNVSLPRTRLCRLAEVDRGKHGRWLDRKKLPKRSAYGLIDVLRAAMLDELSSTLGPKASDIAWQAIQDELGIPGKRLEVVVEMATLSATLVRSDAQLAKALPRGEEVIVVDLSARSTRARERYEQFLSKQESRNSASGSGDEERGGEREQAP